MAASSRERTRRHRERRDRGVVAVVHVEVTEPLVHRLIAEGWLEARDDGGRVRVAKEGIGEALNAMLAE